MQSRYIDQAPKLDVHRLIAGAVRQTRADAYALTVVMEKWPEIPGQPDSNVLAIEVKLERSTDVAATEPITGYMVLKFTMPDGRKCEQSVAIEGTPTRNGGWRWRVAFPCGERAKTLYFLHTKERFDSRKALKLRYRRKWRRQVPRPRVRMRNYLRELEAENPAPYIPKPLWMTEDRYEFYCTG